MDQNNINQYHNYFASRMQAGELIADKLINYRDDNTIVLALSRGGLLVGSKIAESLHSLITMLLTKDIYLPDGRTIVGVVNELGGFVYNNAFSTGEIEELEQEYHGHIEMAKMQALHDLHIALGKGGEISFNYFRNRTVIVTAEAALNGMSFVMAYNFLKQVKTKKVIMVTPVASVAAVDQMHIYADELVCLSVTDAPFEADHYYENNDIPNPEQTQQIMNNIISQWQKLE